MGIDVVSICNARLSLRHPVGGLTVVWTIDEAVEVTTSL
jgi:hypothetical protein